VVRLFLQVKHLGIVFRVISPEATFVPIEVWYHDYHGQMIWTKYAIDKNL
jgi:hypothetical protein